VLTEFSIRTACKCINAGARGGKKTGRKTKPGRRQNIQNIPYTRAVLICVRRAVCWFASISPLIRASEQRDEKYRSEGGNVRIQMDIVLVEKSPVF
jgi:hypothetical protein